MSPLVSVIMSVYQEPDGFIRASIESILRQSMPDFEFIIIQDDPLNEEVVSLLSEYSGQDKRIKYLRNKKNVGLAVSLNSGLQKAQGKYIARMDADDISLPERLQKQLSFLEKNPEISLVGSSVVVIDGGGKALHYLSNPDDSKSLKMSFLRGATPCFHPTWFFRKKLVNILGGYRNLPVGQDYDFLARLIASGFKISNLNDPLVGYRDHPDRIRYKRHVLQIRFGEYIRRGLEKNLICDKCYLNEEVINAKVRVPAGLNTLHRLSQRLSRKGRYFKIRNRLVFASLLLLSGLVSPFQMYCIINEIRRSFRYKSKNQSDGRFQVWEI